VNLDDYLTRRTVCRVLDPTAHPSFALFARTAGAIDRVQVKLVRTLGAETQLLNWRGDTVVLVDTTTLEYALNLFDVMMATEAPYEERQATVKALLYKQWARSFFLSRRTLPAWLVLRWSRRVDDRVAYLNASTRLTSYVNQNHREVWASLFSAFLFGHEMGHVLRRRGLMDEGPFEKFVTDDVHAGRDDAMFARNAAAFEEMVSRSLSSDDKMPEDERRNVLDWVSKSVASADPSLATEIVDSELREELLCDLHACQFVLDTYDMDSASEDFFCYTLPICIHAISFLRIGLANRLWVEYLLGKFESLSKAHGEEKASAMMDGVVEASYTSDEGIRRDVGRTQTRLMRVYEYLVESINHRRRNAARSPEEVELVDRNRILPAFMTQVWIPFHYLWSEALEGTNTEWLNAVFGTAREVEVAARGGHLSTDDIGLPGLFPLAEEEVGPATRRQFLLENGF
jgi:hypothetical protein